MYSFKNGQSEEVISEEVPSQTENTNDNIPNTHSILFRKIWEILNSTWDSVISSYPSFNSSLSTLVYFLLSFLPPSLSPSLLSCLVPQILTQFAF